MKRADHGTKLQGSDSREKRPVASPQTGKKPGDARDEDAKLQQNRQDLGVEEDHKTEEMEDGGRGTFP